MNNVIPPQACRYKDKYLSKFGSRPDGKLSFSQNMGNPYVYNQILKYLSEEADYVISHLTIEGQTVLDPLMSQ